MKYFNVSLTIVILLNLSFQTSFTAGGFQNHLVTTEELQGQLISQSAQRMENIQEVQKLLRHNFVQRELGRLADLERLELALAVLDDETLRRLANESREINDQIEAGVETSTWILIAILVSVPVILFIYLIQSHENCGSC